MNIPKEFPGRKTASRHSAYSKYNSFNPMADSTPFLLKFDKDDIPFRDPTVFKLMTLNLNWFPKSLNSETLFSYILQCSLPDIIFLQEIKHMYILNSLLKIINGKIFPDNYVLIYGTTYSGNMNSAIIYNSHILKPEIHHDLFSKSDFTKTIFSRIPFLASFKILNSLVYFINLHLISHQSSDYSAIRQNCLELLNQYFIDSNYIDPVFIGGDWNIDSGSSMLEKYFPDFHRNLSDFRHKSDYFLLLSDTILSDDLALIKQFKMPVTSIFELSHSDYRKCLSDHYPVILEIPISVFK